MQKKSLAVTHAERLTATLCCIRYVIITSNYELKTRRKNKSNKETPTNEICSQKCLNLLTASNLLHTAENC